MHLIGLTGLSGAGKDTVADLIAERWRCVRHAFADPLREEVARAFDLDPRLLRDRGLKDVSLHRLRLSHCTDAEFVQYAWHLAFERSLKPRTIMETWGDWRATQNVNYYVERAEFVRASAQSLGLPAMVVTDVRLPHEADWLARHGGRLIRIERTGLRPASGHHSQAAIADRTAEVIRNDSSVDELAMRVHDLVGQFLEDRAA